jgi:hypothetical protein
VLHGFLRESCAYLTDKIGVLAQHSVNGLSSIDISRQRFRSDNSETRWQRGSPLAKYPLAFLKSILARLYERRLDFNPALQPMLPLVPGEVPMNSGEETPVQPYLYSPAWVTTDTTICKELAATEQQ